MALPFLVVKSEGICYIDKRKYLIVFLGTIENICFAYPAFSAKHPKQNRKREEEDAFEGVLWDI